MNEDLNRRYFAVFGVEIPRRVLPDDEKTAVELVERAIEVGDDAVLTEWLPEGADI